MFMGLTLARMQAKYVEVDVFCESLTIAKKKKRQSLSSLLDRISPCYSAINYRLAPGSKYPSQLFEAFSAWRHLRQMGYNSIFIGGDSAGANLALTLWRYLDQVAGDSSAVQGLILHSVGPSSQTPSHVL